MVAIFLGAPAPPSDVNVQQTQVGEIFLMNISWKGPPISTVDFYLVEISDHRAVRVKSNYYVFPFSVEEGDSAVMIADITTSNYCSQRSAPITVPLFARNTDCMLAIWLCLATQL